MKNLFFLSLLLFGNFAFSELVNRTLAVVGKELILQSDVDDHMNQPAPSVPTFSAAFGALIEKSLLLSECRKYDYYPTETEVKQQISDIKKQNNLDDNGLIVALAQIGATVSSYEAQLYFEICRNKLVQNKIRNRVNITPSDIERAYNQDPAFSGTSQMSLRGLFVKPKTQSASHKAAAKNQALAIMQLLKKGTTFDHIVSSPAKNDQPLSIEEFGTVSKADLVTQIADVVFSKSSEKFLGPVETDDGFRLFEVLERIEGQRKPLVDEEKDLHKRLFEKEIERLLKQFIEEARASTYVDITESANP